MNAKAINKFIEQSDRSNKSHKGKNMSGKKERATKQYFKDNAAHSRRKQGKNRFDTFRRDEQPDEEDLLLEDIHFANFLGLKDISSLPNTNTFDWSVNINQCDMLCPEPEDADNDSLDSLGRYAIRMNKLSEDGDIDSDDEAGYMLQIERETNTRAYLDLGYIEEIRTLSSMSSNGWYFKRVHNEDINNEPNEDGPPPTKRSKHDNIAEATNADLVDIIIYMAQQVKIATEMMNK